MSIISTVPKGAAVEGINPNLLDNWYFVGNGAGRGVFPVNSRGQTQYDNSSTTGVYCIDSWKNARSKIFLTAVGLAFAVSGSGNTNGFFTQNINVNSFLGKMITCSLLMSAPGSSNAIRFFSLSAQIPATLPSSSQVIASGVYFDTTDTTSWLNLILSSNGMLTFGIYQSVTTASQGRYYKAVKLELGTEQTLAHQENGVWVLNEVPDYEEELIRCQTSTIDSGDTYANKSLATEQQLAYVENGTTASRAYAAGEYFCWNGLLYQAKAAISNGGTFTIGTNCEQVTEGGINALNNKMYQVMYSENGTYTYTMPIGRWFLIYANRANTSGVGLYAAHITGANGYLTTIFETSGFTNSIALSLTGRNLSVQVKSTYATLNILNFGGI